MIPQGFIEVNGLGSTGTVAMTINVGHIAVVHDAPAMGSCKILVSGEWLVLYHSRSDVLAMIVAAWGQPEPDTNPENVHDAYRQGVDDAETKLEEAIFQKLKQHVPPEPTPAPSPMSEPISSMVTIAPHAADPYIQAALDHERGCLFAWQRAHSGLWDLLREIWDVGHEAGIEDGIKQVDAVMPGEESPGEAWSRGWRACALDAQRHAVSLYTRAPVYVDPDIDSREGPTDRNPAE